MVETVIALLMIVNNEIVEARIQDNISICLKHRRHSTRTTKDSISYKCIKSKAEIEFNIDGTKTIKKLILE